MEGEAVFYGPKIDIKIKDALGRHWQCTTIQFDFNMSERFDMTYIAEDGREHRPYMVHRALLGSLERFFGVLIEHYKGSFPLRLRPGVGAKEVERGSASLRVHGQGDKGEVDVARFLEQAKEFHHNKNLSMNF